MTTVVAAATLNGETMAFDEALRRSMSGDSKGIELTWTVRDE